MKKKVCFAVMFLITIELVSDPCKGQSKGTPADWDEIYTKAQGISSIFPTASQIAHSKFPANAKKTLLDERRTLNFIVAHKTAPSASIINGNVNKINSWPGNYKHSVIVFMEKGGGDSKAVACQNAYDNCMKESNCTYSFLCLCCIPCSIEYTGCMANIFKINAGKYGLLVKPTTGPTVTGVKHS